MNTMKRLILSTMALFMAGLASAQPPAGNALVGDNYGDKVQATKVVKANALMTNLKNAPENKIESTVIEGKVLEVCPKKGCWVKIELDNKEVATVKMKGYSFFVPVSLEGKRVKIEGQVEMATTSVAELKHLAEDAKKSQAEIDAINQPQKELKVLASGIEVIK